MRLRPLAAALLCVAIAVPLHVAPAPVCAGAAVALAAPGTTFDAAANPFAYAGEYRDPSWGGAYLRARWYDPRVPSFVSRDPMFEQVNHYGYGGGNPVMHIDPSGRTYQSTVGHAVGHFLSTMNRGTAGHFARVFLGQFLMPLQIAANPGAFWRALSHDTGGVTAFLAAGAVFEAGSYYGMYSSAGRLGAPSSATRLFWRRVLGESVLGGAQAAVGSYSGGYRHFHRVELEQGLESALGPEVAYRLVIGIGYQPFNLKDEDVRALIARHGEAGKALVFRARTDGLTLGRSRARDTWTSPWQDRMDWSHMHGKLYGFYDDRVLTSENNDGIEVKEYAFRKFDMADDPRFPHTQVRFEYIGKFDRDRVQAEFRSNPTNMVTDEDIRMHRANAEFWAQRSKYNIVWRNCQTHVRLIINQLRSG